MAATKKTISLEKHIRPDLVLALGSILFVAGFTRLAHLDLIDFKADEALIAGLARDVLLGKWPATSIQTSLGPFNPPLFVYLVALPMLVSRDPAVLTGLVALLNVGAVVGTYLVGRRFFSRTAGLSGALFFAADPYATLFSRKLWGNFAEPIVAVGLLVCLLAAVERGDKTELPRGAAGTIDEDFHGAGPKHSQAWAWALGILCLALLVQLHPAPILLLPVILILALAYGRWWALPGLSAGAVAGLAIFAPYLTFELAHQPEFFRTLAGAATGAAHWDLESFSLVWILVSSSGYSDVMGAMAGAYRSAAPPYGWLMPLTGMAVVAGLVTCIARWREPRHLTLALFVLVPLLLTIRHAVGLELHYFTFLLPALFLSGGVAVDELLRRWPVAKAPAVILLALLLVGQLASFHFFADFLENQGVSDAYGVPLLYQQRAFDQAVALASGDRILVATTTRDQVETSRYLLYGQPHVEVAADRGLVFPDALRAVYVTLADDTPAAIALKHAGPPRRIIALPGRASGFSIYVLAPTSFDRVQQALNMEPIKRQLGNGVELQSASVPRILPGQLASAWQVQRRVDPTTTIFNQLLDASGKQWFDRDTVPLPASDWQPGDRLIELVQAALPNQAPRQAYWWSTGMYVEGGRRVPFGGGKLEVRLGQMAGGAPPAPVTPPVPSKAVFGRAIGLDGYELRDGRLTLFWRCLKPVATDYTVFVHVLSPAGGLIAQHDSQPLDGRFPTSLWQSGEAVADPVALVIPPGSSVELGLYDLKTGQRLKLADGSDHVMIHA